MKRQACIAQARYRAGLERDAGAALNVHSMPTAGGVVLVFCGPQCSRWGQRQ